jgi:hypothetical protein
MSEQLQIFYTSIEAEYTIKNHSINLFSSIGDLSDDDKIFILYEYIALNNFESDLFKERIFKEKNHIISYISQRIEIVKNIHLLARYYHLLLYVSQNKQFATKTVEYYQKVLIHYLSICDQNYNVLYFSDTLKVIISICTKYKINEANLKAQINNYLHDVKLSPKIKTFIFENIRDGKLFKGKELNDFPQLCINLFNIEIDSNIRERLLVLAISFSQKTKNSELFKIANELSGDFEYRKIQPHDDYNIAISHINESIYKKIIKYYNLARNKSKQVKATKELEENKKYHKYINFQFKIPLKNTKQVNNLIREHIDDLLKNSSTSLVYSLCFGNKILLLPPYDKIQASVKEQMSKTIYHKFLESKFVDINGNITSIPYETVEEHQFFHFGWQNCSFPFMIDFFTCAISKHKLSYFKIKRALIKSAFGMKFEVTRGNKIISYNWFSLIDIGIQEFFKQFSKHINQKKTDWRFMIDFLAPKFETILRYIIQNTNGEITKVKDNGDTKLKSLEDLLDTPVIKEIFDEYDIFLFKHTFTKVWFNIRNDVAHGLCIPFDYSLSKALLVLLCILRLNKVSLYLAKDDK